MTTTSWYIGLGGKWTNAADWLAGVADIGADTAQQPAYFGSMDLGRIIPLVPTPIDTNKPFYLQSNVGKSVLPDFQGGTLRINSIGVTDHNDYTVENFSTNTIDAFGHSIVFSGTFSGAGPLTIEDSVGGGAIIMSGASVIGGTLTIDIGATLQWGDGNAAFLVGPGNGVVDNGTLLMDFGGSGIGGSVPISGSGKVTIQSGSFNESGASTYTGSTIIDAAGILNLSGTGSIASSSVVVDNGTFDISGTSGGTSITTLTGSGLASLGGQTLTITSGSGIFSGVLADGGLFGGTAGSLTIAGGTATLSGTNTFTGATTINSGAVLQLGAGGTTGTVAGSIVDNGLVRFDYSGRVTAANTFSGSGSVEVATGTVVETAASFVGGTVTIDHGATLQWGNGGPAFLLGSGNGVVDNGTLLLDFGGGGIAGSVPISGSGKVTIQSGSLNDSGASSYTGSTIIDAAGELSLTGTGSIASSSAVADNGTFDISGTYAGASIKSLTGSGSVELGAQTLTITNASGTFSGVLADGGLFGGTGGSLTIAGGTVTLTGTNTFTGATTIDSGATLQLGDGGTTGTVAGNIDLAANATLKIDHSAGTSEIVSLALHGSDVVTGGAGNETFDVGATLSATDQINGGSGTNTVKLDGDYSGGLIFSASTMVNVEKIVIAAGHSYSLTTADATVAAGQTLTVNASALRAGDVLTFNGGHETNGRFVLAGGAGNDVLTGGAGNDVFTGNAGNDTFNLSFGGNDTASGGLGNDTFVMGAALTAADKIDGGNGNDTVMLNGDYSAGVVFGAKTMASVEKIVVAAGHSYNLATADATVAAGQTLTVDGSALRAGDVLTFNGGHETNGRFALTGGAGNDVLTGGAGNDVLTGGGGADVLTGGGGHDQFQYVAVSDSTGSSYDRITDFDATMDKFVLPTTVTGVDSEVTVGALSQSSFNTDLSAALTSAQLAIGHAVLFAPNSGTLAGHIFLVVDANGTAGYQAHQDYVFDITGAAHLSSLSPADFI